MKKQNEIQIKQLELRGKIIPGIYYMDQSDMTHYCYTIMKDNKGQMDMIGKTFAWKKKDIVFGMDPIATPIKCSFKQIKCAACEEKVPAIMMGKSEIGNICMWCIESMSEPIEFELIDEIEKYFEE